MHGFYPMFSPPPMGHLFSSPYGTYCHQPPAFAPIGFSSPPPFSPPGMVEPHLPTPVTKDAGVFIKNYEHAIPELMDSLAVLSEAVASTDDASKFIMRSDLDIYKAAGKVALISGGGSGHEPAHAGYVGTGMLSAAVLGNLFASPSVDQILGAIRRCTGAGGCLLIVKNYTGDRLSFGLAAELAVAEGLSVETILVADDSPSRNGKCGSRGVAGTVLVHKILGSLAESGASLSVLHTAALSLCPALSSAGVAKSLCVIPGSSTNRSLVAGHLDFGVGIHGEPGTADLSGPSASADAVLGRLLSSVLAKLAALHRLSLIAPDDADDEVAAAWMDYNIAATAAGEQFVASPTSPTAEENRFLESILLASEPVTPSATPDAPNSVKQAWLTYQAAVQRRKLMLEEAPAHHLSAAEEAFIDSVQPDDSEETVRPCVLIVNNLGAMPNLDLLVVAGRMVSNLATRNYKVCRVGCGTYMSAYNMDGFSVTVLDLSLCAAGGLSEATVLAALDASTSAMSWLPLSKSPSSATVLLSDVTPALKVADCPVIETTFSSLVFDKIVRGMASALLQQKEHLNHLDAVAGDGDTGTAVALSANAAIRVLDQLPGSDEGPCYDYPEALRYISLAIRANGGGTFGVIVSFMLLRVSRALASGSAIIEALEDGANAASSLSGAQPGDKTIFDALFPALHAARESSALVDASVLEIVAAMRDAADLACKSIATTKASAGRASYAATGGAGSPDPGASALVIALNGAVTALHSL